MRILRSRRLQLGLTLGLTAGLLAGWWEDIHPVVRGLLAGVVVLATVLAIRGEEADDSDPGPLLEILEAVTADEARRPWSPTTSPWLPTGNSPKPVLMVPAADYHLAEMVPLARELNRRDIRTRIAVGESPWARTWRGLAWYPDLEVLELPQPPAVTRDVSLVVTMKDTGSMTEWVTAVRAGGVRVFGKVEGAQDFWDADTPEERRPYRNLDLVLCQGQFDADALSDRVTAVVGSTRLERLWWAPPVSALNDLAVINLNFVYGVRTVDRRLWLETAIAGCEKAGIPYVISVHPAEKSLPGRARATRISASRLLPHASVLISRFSTVPLEALAMGVPFIYHNPHGETVKTFDTNETAFSKSANVDELDSALRLCDDPGQAVRDRAASWLSYHVSLRRDQTSEMRAAVELTSQSKI